MRWFLRGLGFDAVFLGEHSRHI